MGMPIGMFKCPTELFRFNIHSGTTCSSSDFLSNLIVLLFRIRNAGLDDGGLLAHLSEATAGSLTYVDWLLPFDAARCPPKCVLLIQMNHVRSSRGVGHRCDNFVRISLTIYL